MRAALWLAAVMLATVPAACAHEPGTPFAGWLSSLKMPDRPGVSCCGLADQYYADEYREAADGSFVVRVGTEWIDVPPEKVDWNSPNPTGRGVIFLSPGGVDERQVYCFVPALGM